MMGISGQAEKERKNWIINSLTCFREAGLLWADFRGHGGTGRKPCFYTRLSHPSSLSQIPSRKTGPMTPPAPAACLRRSRGRRSQHRGQGGRAGGRARQSAHGDSLPFPSLTCWEALLSGCSKLLCSTLNWLLSKV